MNQDKGSSYLLIRLLIVATAFLMCAWLDPYKDEVAQGNRQLKDKNITEAKQHYKHAERYAPSGDDLKNLEFNKAAADFISGDTDSAIDGYRNALRSEDKNVQKKAFYSLGNVYYKARKKKEAAQAYMNALKLDPKYENAKKNLEYIFLYNGKEDQNRNRNDDGESNKGDDDKDKNRKNKKNQKKFGDDDSGRKLDMQQARNILESMKHSKVRQEKGKRHASHSLEKYW
jgi:tetratricopeptide (TPR) repeat protein